MNIREKLRYLITGDKEELYTSIAKCILLETANRNYPNMEEVAKKCFTTKSSITRFCKKLDFDGWKEFIYQLKFEDLNYYEVDQSISNVAENYNYFEIYKSELIDWISYSSAYLNDLIQIRDLIFNAENIYIFCSFELENTISFFIDYLMLNKKNVFYSQSRKSQSALLSNVTKDDLQIYFVAGVDNNYLSNLAETLTKEEYQKVIISSKSQSEKFQDFTLKMEINYPKEIVNIHNKQIYLTYLLKQLSNIYSEKMGASFKNNQKVLF